MRSTAVAFPNIALIKYWGKRDEALIIPQTSSLSLTLAVYPTTTTVTLAAEAEQHQVLQDGAPMPQAASVKVARFLDHVGQLAGSTRAARVETSNAGVHLGAVEDLVVDGAINGIDASSVETVSFAGDGNRVSTPSTPEVTDDGDKNTVTY